MTKQAETSNNSEHEQIEEQIKCRNLLDKDTNSNDNVLDFFHIKQLDNDEQNFQKSIKNSTESGAFSSNTSYKADYSTTSSRISNCSQTGKHKQSAELNSIEKKQAEFKYDQSWSSSDQESSLLDISFSSSVSSQLLESSSHLEPFSTSVTNITDFSESTFMEPKKDQIKISQKTYLGPGANLKAVEDGWIMRETVIKSVKKNNLQKGTSCEKRSKSRQRQGCSTLDNKFKYSIYPVTLRYYLHLYNEKQKKIDQKKNIPLLYNKTMSPSVSSKSSSSNSSSYSVDLATKKKIKNKEYELNTSDSSFDFEMINKTNATLGALVSSETNKLKNKNSKSTADLEFELTQIIDKIISRKERSKSEYRRDARGKDSSQSRCRSRHKIKSNNRASKSYDQKFSSRNLGDSSENSLVDTTNSGGGLVTAEIKLDNQMVTFDLKKINDTNYELKLIPRQVGEYKIFMFLNNQSVKGSPFSVKIESLDGTKITKNLSFNKIQSQQVNEPDCKYFDDNFNMSTRKIINNSDHTFKTDVFELSNRNEDLIVGEQVRLNVRIIDYGQKSNQLSETKIDTKVTHNEKLVKHKVELSQSGIYQIKFLPAETGIYNVFFFKNGTKCEGCPYKLNVKGRFLREIKKPKYAQIGVPYILNVEYCNVTNLKAIVFTEKTSTSSLPLKSNKTIAKLINLPVEKIIQSDSKLRLKFVPLHASEHVINIVDNGISIEGFPLKINVFPSNEIFLVTENTNGTQKGSLARFRIYLNGIKDSLNIKITNIDSGNSQFATFLLDQEYQLSNHIFAALGKFLRIDQNRIKNRDVTIENGYTRVIFTIEEEEQMPNNSVLKILKNIIENKKFVIIDLSLNKTIKALTNSFKFGAKGENVGFKLTKQTNMPFDYLGEFEPSAIGRYRIDVENFNIPINNSPFFINVFDPNLIKIEHIPSTINVGDENFIEIDRSLTGFSELETTILAPSGIKLPFKIESSQNHKIRFIAREIGIHKFSVKLGDCLITNSTFEINAKENFFINVYGNGLYNGLENTYSIFYAQIVNSIQGKLEIDICDPCGNLIKSYTSKINDYLYEIKYIPHKIGKYKIHIKFDGEKIPSSPFTANVINPDKVTIKDDCQYFFNARNVDLEINQEKYFCFNTLDAGDGNIQLDIIAPNDQLLPYRKKISSHNEHKISFCPVFEGLYKIHVYFNNQELRFSPIYTKTDKCLETNAARVYGDGIKNANLNKESNFLIDLTNLDTTNENFNLSVTAISAESHVLKFDVEKIKDKMYNCIFTPDKIGDYLLNVKLNNIHIWESPFILKVRMSTDPTKIIINTNDFKSIIIGDEVSTIVDTRGAGAGELSANCLGLTKHAECQFIDRKDGTYELKIRPDEIGKHLLSLKYNDVNVSNSPFTFKVSSLPDASKVQVFGPGISHGVIDEFKSNFTCDTRGAGAGQLTVRIRGPKGAFRVDMQRKDEKDRRIECSYDPLESGEYQINVKWSGKHVPNSPFNVNIFKTNEELDKFLYESIQDKNLKCFENDK
ncbi:Filamin/ABP280 repeat containing protein [Brachionus plicatilis]|uniref:Filamin/ABP280 repeat containing protein n=1 Tax=Brachionus plicatilis TaxID=10195 RepID=A0A3M7RA48_BRAPC|nr:Filamin/ABP280 repeat containing protein [Brachionus plicatilis]